MTPMEIKRGYPQPLWRITLAGEDITQRIQPRLMQLTLTDNRGMEADQLDLTLDDSDGRLDIPTRGASIHLSLGWSDTGLIDKGSYTVDEVEHSGTPDQLTIRARSADLREGHHHQEGAQLAQDHGGRHRQEDRRRERLHPRRVARA